LTPNVVRSARKRKAIVLMLSFDYFVYQFSPIPTKSIFREWGNVSIIEWTQTRWEDETLHNCNESDILQLFHLIDVTKFEIDCYNLVIGAWLKLASYQRREWKAIQREQQRFQWMYHYDRKCYLVCCTGVTELWKVLWSRESFVSGEAKISWDIYTYTVYMCNQKFQKTKKNVCGWNNVFDSKIFTC
jgi:hypothetical protein